MAGGELENLLGAPTSGSDSVVDDSTFSATIGLIQFDLLNISVGTGTNAACGSNLVGNACTPTGSLFTVTQQGTVGAGNVCDPAVPADACAVTITFNLNGIAYLTGSGSGSDVASGAFTAQAPGAISSELAAIASTAGSTELTFSASFSVTPSSVAPEPGGPLMILAGLGMLGASHLRRAGK